MWLVGQYYDMESFCVQQAIFWEMIDYTFRTIVIQGIIFWIMGNVSKMLQQHVPKGRSQEIDPLRIQHSTAAKGHLQPESLVSPQVSVEFSGGRWDCSQ